MKVFAFFLPQFHEIPENDDWWGKGFTEWTNVKRGEPLFSGHKQPKEPLNDFYYNLLDNETVEWQTKLMHDYSIDGLIYYHYYFNGKLLLEKPAENLLHNKTINQKFFFCWGNHSWRRSWEGKTDILLEQTYGTVEDWENHFQYLIRFFKDERYEKKNNMPLFMIFNQIPNGNEMFEYFEKRCKDYGFDGLYLIETFHGTRFPLGWLRPILLKTRTTKRIFIRQPTDAFKYCNRHHTGFVKCDGVTVYNGNDLYDYMIKHCKPFHIFINGIFFEWDNTPRHKRNGYVITPPDKDRFFKMFSKLNKADYVFINAWNEWAEGMIMEPTKENGYKYLEWVRDCK